MEENRDDNSRKVTRQEEEEDGFIESKPIDPAQMIEEIAKGMHGTNNRERVSRTRRNVKITTTVKKPSDAFHEEDHPKTSEGAVRAILGSVNGPVDREECCQEQQQTSLSGWQSLLGGWFVPGMLLGLASVVLLVNIKLFFPSSKEVKKGSFREVTNEPEEEEQQ